MRTRSNRFMLAAVLVSVAVLPSSASWLPNALLNDRLGVLELRKDLLDRNHLEPRGVPCGYKNWLTCPDGSTCWTDYNDDAQCSYGAATTPSSGETGSWRYYTTTYTQTNYVIKTITSSEWCPGQVIVTTTEQCDECPTPETITVTDGGGATATPPGGATTQSTITTTETANSGITSGTTPVTGFSFPVTATASPTTPAGVITGVSSTSSGGLSGGAIAGIVIGVIAAIIILLLICLCCCAKGLIDGFLGLFGLGKRRTVREEEVIEERRSHRGGRTWFGSRPQRTSRASYDEKRKSRGGFSEWLGVAGALGALAVFLGMKRRRDHKDDKSHASSYNYSDYSYSYSSPSSASSDRRSRRTASRSRASGRSRSRR